MTGTQFFVPEEIICSSFVARVLQPNATRLALIFELCKEAGQRNRLSREKAIERWRGTWFQDFSSPQIQVARFARGKKQYPDYFINYACAGHRLDSEHPFYTRSHFGAVFETPDHAYSRFMTVIIGYQLLARPTRQGVIEFGPEGNLAKILAYLHFDFTTSLKYNPLEGHYVQCLARQAVISQDFGFTYELLKVIDENLDNTDIVKAQSDIGPLVEDVLTTLKKGFKQNSPKMNWLTAEIKKLHSKRSDFEKQDYCTLADTHSHRRCAMLTDTGLLETGKYGNWSFRGFDTALHYFDRINDAIKELSTDSAFWIPYAGWYARTSSSTIIPLAWNFHLNKIEPRRVEITDDDIDGYINQCLIYMVNSSSHRIYLVEFYSLMHFCNPDKYFHPVKIHQKLLSLRFLSVAFNSGEPVIQITNPRVVENLPTNAP